MALSFACANRGLVVCIGATTGSLKNSDGEGGTAIAFINMGVSKT